MAADTDAWHARFTADGPLRVGYTPGEVFHLWHGRFADRRYRERDEILVCQADDPTTDIAQRGGVHEWASAKPELHAQVRDYFYSRAEDTPILPRGAPHGNRAVRVQVTTGSVMPSYPLSG